ncbi:MAG: GDP-mannose 4,6-dehydratase [Candidatus Methanomethylicia archaeon]
MNSIIVTGGAGFIGSYIVSFLLNIGYKVTVIDNLSRGSLRNLQGNIGKENFKILTEDVRNPNVHSILKKAKAIIHLAALVSVEESIENPILYHDVNVNGTLNLLNGYKDSSGLFIYVSSAAVYGEPIDLPLRENSLPRPVSPYGVSKLCAEYYVKVFGENYNFKTLILRLFNVYGPRQWRNPYAGVINKFIENIYLNKPLAIYGSGEQTRDFIHVRDAARAIVSTLNLDLSGEVINIASGKPTRIIDLALKVKDIAEKKLNKTISIVYSKSKPGDIMHSYASIEKSEKLLGFRPEIDLNSGLKELIDQYELENR